LIGGKRGGDEPTRGAMPPENEMLTLTDGAVPGAVASVSMV